MSLDRFKNDYTTDVLGGRLTGGIKRRLLGSPGRVLSLLVTVAGALLLAGAVYGTWAIVSQQTSTSGSSYWMLDTLANTVTSPWVLVLAILYAWYKYVGVLRKREANRAGDRVGWLPETILQLRDEVRTTRYTTRVIATSDHALSEIKDHVRQSLREGTSPAESVDYWGRGPGYVTGKEGSGNAPYYDELPEGEEMLALPAPEEDGEDVPEMSAEVRETLGPEVDVEGLSKEELDRLVNADGSVDRDALADLDLGSQASAETDRTRADEEEVEEAKSVRGRVRAFGASIVSKARTVGGVIRTAVGLAWSALVFLATGPVAFARWVGSLLGFGSRRSESAEDDAPESETESGAGSRPDVEEDVPWRVQFAEELKHTMLHFSAAWRTGDIIWQFGLPAGVMMAFQVLAVRIWTSGLAYIVFLLNSVVVGLIVMRAIERRRASRLQTYRTPGEAGYWKDTAGYVKTVPTADVTAYIGFLNGSVYASYDEDEFVHEFSLRMWQRVNNEEVAPSVLEKHARNLREMKPNLQGHVRNVELQLIQRELAMTIESAPDQLIPKAELAYEVINATDSGWFGDDIGYDPKLVANVYRFMGEDARSIEEFKTENADANNETTDLTIVYPTTKRRLPEVSQLHTQFSDRFQDLHGEAIYQLPDLNPSDHLRGHKPSLDAYKQFDFNVGATADDKDLPARSEG